MMNRLFYSLHGHFSKMPGILPRLLKLFHRLHGFFPKLPRLLGRSHKLCFWVLRPLGLFPSESTLLEHMPLSTHYQVRPKLYS